MASSHELLVSTACEMLDEFGSDQEGLFEVMEEASDALQHVDFNDKNFILEIVSGCIEHKPLLDVVVKVFYQQSGKRLSLGDRSQFIVICYLLAFALDDIGLECFSSIVKSLDIEKMQSFLTFFFRNLTTWIQGEWSHVYDAAYVERNWIVPLLRWRPQIDVLIAELDAKMSRRNQFKKHFIKPTVPLEFSLTRPRPRPLPIPELIPVLEKHKPVPKSTYYPPKEWQTLELTKNRNRRKAEKKLYEANVKLYRCGNTEKSEHAQKVLRNIQDEFESKLKFNSFKSSGLPASYKRNSDVPVKMTCTSLLRQRALGDHLMLREQERLERLLEGYGEPSTFQRWQNDMRKRDIKEEAIQAEVRRLEGRIINAKVAMVRSQIMESKREAAILHKEEMAKQMYSYVQKQLQEERELRDAVQQGYDNTKEAKKKMLEMKKTIAKEVSQQNKALLRQAQEEKQAELSRKCETIREVHAIESVPQIRGRLFDDTETGGHGVIDEMSIAEAKERLALLRETRQQEQRQRRLRVLKDRQSKMQFLTDNIDTVAFQRKALAQAVAFREEEKKICKQGILMAVSQDERIVSLRQKVEETQREHQRRKQTEHSRGTMPRQVVTQSSISEVKDWEQLEEELQRQVQSSVP